MSKVSGTEQLKLIGDRGLIFIAVIALAIVGAAGGLMSASDWKKLLAFETPVIGAGLAALWLFYRKKENENAEINRLKAELARFTREATNPAVSVITKQDYARILAEWNQAEGEGQVLLYNIELQSFENQKAIQQTWGRLKEMANVKEIALLLPTAKVRRWESIVVQQESAFFSEAANRKFTVCEFAAGNTVGEGPAPIGVAFALYRFVSGPNSGKLHPKAVWFILSRPFSKLQRPFVEGDAPWWDYHDILAINGRDDLRAKAVTIWDTLFEANQTRDVGRVLQDSKPLQPVAPSDLFVSLGLSEAECNERLRQFQPRRVSERDPLAIPFDRPNPIFTIKYDNGDTIQGHYEGINADLRQTKPGLVWVGGFTEKQYTRLPELFERVLQSVNVVQFYYEVSPPIADVTLSRYQEDMREVLRYVNKQEHIVIPHKLVLVARSINGLLAALVGAEEEFRSMLSGLILVAPVFDVIEMIDNYRARRNQPHVRLEKCWRRTPGFDNGKVWETSRREGDPRSGWLEFFAHDVHLTILADIIRHPPETFSFSAFKNAVGRISERCPVFVLSDPKDAITGSEKALAALEAAASGTGLIRKENYQYQPIQSGHLLPEEINRDRYPFILRQEAANVRDALRRILRRMDVPTTDDDERLIETPENSGRGSGVKKV
jgi:hypothetical protein